MSESGEKQFAPTEKRKKDAALKGDVLRSKDLATAASVLVGFGLLAIAGPWLGGELMELVRASLSFDHGAVEQGIDPRGTALRIAGVMAPVAALGLVLALVSVVSQLGFGSGRWVPENLAFKGSRINPLSGLKRVFGPTGWIEMGKGLAKVGLLGTIAYAWARSWLGDLGRLANAGLADQLGLAWHALLSLAFALGGGLLIIAMIDVPVQIWRRQSRLKMSQQEMKDENKETDGSPEARAHRRQRQRDIAAGSVAPAMREAQFVITNPTHFAVALTYDPTRAAAPILLAKGRGEKALAIRELAGERNLPVLEFPALARSIYYTTREKQVIREELYAAVAAIVAYVMALGRGETPPFPQLSVPVRLRYDADGKVEA
ncbi:flagellar type III secretion system protein FlhB [Porphyrobacter algicida]|uniref:Flagellar type III secretion system protein FlhB n=1 Tax=Qipengyuania algicida TaxID=1836209 RepID=A0A845ABM0_9SPHN|nr:EscU/YscU/HrcU family type III secretion system export apparatus switch protein [Qipengyuania algicida]MXP27640.1 flagellar type III secretion system protein FlhB [Qipengyuania algicida]